MDSGYPPMKKKSYRVSWKLTGLFKGQWMHIYRQYTVHVCVSVCNTVLLFRKEPYQ